MFFFVGALVLAFFGGLFFPLLVGLPWWVAFILIPILISVRIILTDRINENKFLDIGNGVIIAIFVLKLLF